MKQELSRPVVAAIVAIVVVAVTVFGYWRFAGTGTGTKPHLDPVLNRMYGPHPVGSEIPAPQSPPTQGQ